jgi:hypothetical protein
MMLSNVAIKQILSGKLCKEGTCYVPTRRAFNNFYTYTIFTVGFKFYDF